MINHILSRRAGMREVSMRPEALRIDRVMGHENAELRR